MPHKVIIVTIIVLVMVMVIVQEIQANGYFIRRHNSPHEYAVLGAVRSWTDAEYVCKSHGAKLVKIEHEKDTAFIFDLPHTETSHSKIFLGLKNHYLSTRWIWEMDKRGLKYWNNEPGRQEDIPQETIACAVSSRSGKWRVIDCHREYEEFGLVVCQRKKTHHETCSDHPCEHGGTCINTYAATGLKYRCECHPAYTGGRCEHEIDECASNPCHNGARCMDGVGKYYCTCETGFTGGSCQQNIDDCLNNTCQNGATCVDGINSYSCECKIGTSGPFCEMVTTTTTARLTKATTSESQYSLKNQPEQLSQYSRMSAISTTVLTPIVLSLVSLTLSWFCLHAPHTRQLPLRGVGEKAHYRKCPFSETKAVEKK